MTVRTLGAGLVLIAVVLSNGCCCRRACCRPCSSCCSSPCTSCYTPGIDAGPPAGVITPTPLPPSGTPAPKPMGLGMLR